MADDHHARRPSSRTNSASRSRICACTMTSSAVVGSSATISCGPAGQRHRDHHALLLAAGELVRVRTGPRPRQPDLLEQLADALDQVAVVRSSCRGSTIASAIWSSTRRTGLSECSAPWKMIDASAQRTRAELAPAHGQHVLEPSTSTSPDDRPRPSAAAAARCSPASTCRSRTRRRPRRTSPAPTHEVDAAHGGQRTLGGLVRHGEPAQSRASPPVLGEAVISASCSLGLKISSSAWPTRVNDRTTSDHAHARRDDVPPRAGRHGADVEGVLEHGPPRHPRRVARGPGSSAWSRSGSRSATVSVVFANTIGITFGSTCRVIWCQRPAPSTRARSR